MTAAAQVGWIAAIIIGGIAGWPAEQFMKSDTGLLMNIVLGVVAAAIASAILSLLGIVLGGWIGCLVLGFIAPFTLIWIVRAVRGRTGGGAPRQGKPALAHARKRRRLQDRVRKVSENGPVLLTVRSRSDPFRVALKRRPFLLALGKRLPGQKISQLVIRLADHRRPEAGLSNAVLIPHP